MITMIQIYKTCETQVNECEDLVEMWSVLSHNKDRRMIKVEIEGAPPYYMEYTLDKGYQSRTFADWSTVEIWLKS